MLYLVATPIGNLGDMSFRAVETLKNCHYILCEDTRHSLLLLKHYQIQKPLKSYHKFNEASVEKRLLQDLEAGLAIALISDAGTPGIADPGSRLVKSCVTRNIPLLSIPGPCAAITAITASGLSTDRFQFVGFLPRKKNELNQLLKELLVYPGTSITYESPQRILGTLKQVSEILPEWPLVIARELTKKFEELLRGTAQELVERLQTAPIKGEIVLLFSQAPVVQQWTNLSPEQHVELLMMDQKLSKQKAIKEVAKLRGVPKRDVYNLFHLQNSPHCL